MSSDNKLSFICNLMLRKEFAYYFIPITAILIKDKFAFLTQSSSVIFWIVDVAVFIAIPTACIWILVNFHNVKIFEYGFFKPYPKYLFPKNQLLYDTFFAIVVFFLIAFGLSFILSVLVARDSVTPTYTLEINDYSPLYYWIAKLYLASSAAFVEEIFFRGMLLKFTVEVIQNKRYTSVVYLLVSSTLFTLIHLGLDNVALVTIFFIGLASCGLYLKFKRLEPLIVAHFVLDMLLI